MRISLTQATALTAIVIALCGCSHASTAPAPPQAKTYQQIERLAEPAVKEAFENFQDHDATNRTTPANDSLLQGQVNSFMTTVAGRSQATSNAIISVLFPFEITANMSVNLPPGGQPAGRYAAYLGIQTGGATGNTFGGRWLNDDTIKTSLGAIFGNTLAALGAAPEDGKESWCLADDNLSNGEGTFQSYGNTFPYVNAPY